MPIQWGRGSIVIMSRTRCIAIAIVGFQAAALPPSLQGAVSFELDYTYDIGGFFTAEKRSLMSLVAGLYEARLEDSLDAVTPGGSDHWTLQFYSPADGSLAQVIDPTLAADTVRIYLGARNLGGSTLGVGGFGGIASGSGSGAFVTSASTRGQAGVGSNTDFGPWGGSITFNSTSTWHVDADPASLESFAGQNDFYSVALHEMGHLLGIGTADSFAHHVNGSHEFTGPNAVASNGGNVPLTNADDHWADGTTSTVAGTATPQEAAMDPTITVGTRKHLTDLDWAALEDIGWQVTPVPEPSTVMLLLLGGAGLLRLHQAAGKSRRS